jgi:prepilin-type N-terminal cleavage/methylation domain-containing protein
MGTITRNQHKAQKGFTLIELSIVLIIIGLIVSGVLVGQDLISGAKLRAQITQISEFNAGVNTFKLKYDALPGDILTPANYALSSTNIAGDADGLLEDDSNDNTIEDASDEITGFWTHLSQVGLIQGSYVACVAGGGCVLTTNIPTAKIGTGGVGVYGVSGVNYYQIGAASSAAGGAADYANNLTPLEAQTIDGKLDNAIPGTGIVLGRTGTTPNGTATGSCVTDVGADTTITSADVAYTLTNTTAVCQVRIKMS